jgi:hypothetical protein
MSMPATVNVILTLVAALPDAALRPLLLRLLLQDGAGANNPRETSDVSRRPGWPKGKPRGKRKPASATARRSKEMATADAASARLAAQRRRDARLKRERRAAARQAKGANGSAIAAAAPLPAPAPDRAAAKRAAHAGVMRKRRARDAAARPASDADKAAGTTAAAKLWAHAVTLNAKEPWKPVAARLNLNMALCVDGWRSRGLPIGVTPAEVTRFVEPAAN